MNIVIFSFLFQLYYCDLNMDFSVCILTDFP